MTLLGHEHHHQPTGDCSEGQILPFFREAKYMYLDFLYSSLLSVIMTFWREVPPVREPPPAGQPPPAEREREREKARERKRIK